MRFVDVMWKQHFCFEVEDGFSRYLFFFGTFFVSTFFSLSSLIIITTIDVVGAAVWLVGEYAECVPSNERVKFMALFSSEKALKLDPVYQRL